MDLRTIGLGLVFALCPACGPSDIPDPEPQKERRQFECGLGVMSNGVYSPLSSDTKLELELGFQGFLFVTLAVQADAVDASRFDCRYSAEIELEPEPIGGVQKGIEFVETPSGASVAEYLLFLDSSDKDRLIGQRVDLAARILNDTSECLVSGRGILVDDDPCIHTDAEPICP